MNETSKLESSTVQLAASSDFELDETRVDPEALADARAQYEAGDAIPGAAVLNWLASWGSEEELPPPRRAQ